MVSDLTSSLPVSMAARGQALSLPGVDSGARYGSLDEPLLAGQTLNEVSPLRTPAAPQQKAKERWVAEHQRLLEQVASTWSGKQFREVVRDIWSKGLHHELFDGSLSRAQCLYRAVVEGQNGVMNFDAFDVALRAERFVLRDYEAGRQLFAVLTENKGELDEITFHLVLQRLKLQVLNDLAADPRVFSSGANASMGWCMDWSASTFTCRVLAPSNMQEHVMSQRDGQRRNRWCHYDQPDDLTVICMGVKYQLQADAMDIFRSARLEGRVWLRGADLSVLLPITRLTQASYTKYVEFKNKCRRGNSGNRDDIRKQATQDRMVVAVEQAHLCLFLSKEKDTLFTAIGPWSASISSLKSADVAASHRSVSFPGQGTGQAGASVEHNQTGGPESRSRRFSLAAPKSRGFRRRHTEDLESLTCGFHDNRGTVDSMTNDFETAVSVTGSFFQETVQALSINYSELRIGDVCRLFVRLVRGVLDQYRTVNKAVFLRLNWYEEHLDEDAGHEILEMQKEIQAVQWRLDQIAEVIARLVSYQCCEPEVNATLNFAVDDAKALSSRMSRASELCIRLRDQVQLHEQSRENRSVVSITVLVTLLWPLQFLTGVYGMNFQDAEGHGTVPFLGDLTLTRSYYMFWGLGFAMILMLASYFKFVGIL